MNQRQMRNRIRILETTIAALEYFAQEVETKRPLQLDDESLKRLVGAGRHLDEAYKAHRMVPEECRPVGATNQEVPPLPRRLRSDPTTSDPAASFA